jgi:hypothetical protein
VRLSHRDSLFTARSDPESLTLKRARAPGRSWTAPELRLKSFTELHQLWYILLRERNVLLTQREEARRLRVDLSGYTAVPDKLRLVRLASLLPCPFRHGGNTHAGTRTHGNTQCQKSMARIKQVISERRHAALQAAQILRERGQLAQAEQVEHEAKVAQEAVDQSGR